MSPPPVEIPLRLFSAGTNAINILLTVNDQEIRLNATLTFQTSMKSYSYSVRVYCWQCVSPVATIDCGLVFTGAVVRLTCSQNGVLFTGTATYSINNSPNQVLVQSKSILRETTGVRLLVLFLFADFPVDIPTSDFNIGNNDLDVFLVFGDGRVESHSFNVPLTGCVAMYTYVL